MPIANSGERYSFHESEIAILDALREWSRDYFSKVIVHGFETHIPNTETVELGFTDSKEQKTMYS